MTHPNRRDRAAHACALEAFRAPASARVRVVAAGVGSLRRVVKALSSVGPGGLYLRVSALWPVFFSLYRQGA